MTLFDALLPPLVSRLNVTLVSPATLSTFPPLLVVGLSGAAIFASMRLYAAFRNRCQETGELTSSQANLLLARHVLSSCAVIGAAVGVLVKAPIVFTAGAIAGASLLVWAAMDLLCRKAGDALEYAGTQFRNRRESSRTSGGPDVRAPCRTRTASPNQQEIILRAFSENLAQLQRGSDQIAHDRKVIVRAIRQGAAVLRQARGQVLNHHEPILRPIQQAMRAFQQTRGKLSSHRKWFLGGIQRGRTALRNAQAELRNYQKTHLPASSSILP